VPDRIRARTDSCSVGPNASESYSEIKQNYQVPEAAVKSTKSTKNSNPQLSPIQALVLVIPSAILHMPISSSSLVLLTPPPVLSQSQHVTSAVRMSCNSEDPRSVIHCLCRWHRVLQSPLLASKTGNFDVLKTSVFESPHPYHDNSDVTMKMTCAGAVRMEVVFDPRSATVSMHFISVINRSTTME
jgi:hypothetical protein